MDKILSQVDIVLNDLTIDCNIDNNYSIQKKEQFAKSLQVALNCYRRRHGDKIALLELIKRLSQAGLFLDEQEKKEIQNKKDEKVVCCTDDSRI